ncbi:hypothetical protein CV102_22005 [Natronococcus pandeyae]|uniref:PH domain-containing protein n=1 Tax=Natronococcus pandeyae TaxID=2055836 RepID=A0A8J8PXX6_9EURY|nr:hypothetical protein [Natronococcus pandeyae]TYL36500.1 hypothetical protein CV102_22005 [Natronococcus pandeyae]
MTGSDFDRAATPTTWSLALGGLRDHVLVTVAVLAVAPRWLWTWVVLVQPAIALVATAWIGTVALAVFAAVALAPAAVAWWLAIRQRRLGYTVSPTRATLRIRHLGTESEAAPETDVVDLRGVGGIAAVPLRGRVAVRFHRGRTRESEPRSVPRVVVVPADRWPAFAAALDRAGVSLPWGEPADPQPPLGVVAIVAVSVIVPIAGATVGVVLAFRWLILF